MGKARLVISVPREIRRPHFRSIIAPEKTRAVIDRASWPRPAVFEWLQREGKVAEAEMHRVFNCGIGMAVVVAVEHADAAVRILSGAGETVFRIGRIEARKGAEPQALIA